MSKARSRQSGNLICIYIIDIVFSISWITFLSVFFVDVEKWYSIRGRQRQKEYVLIQNSTAKDLPSLLPHLQEFCLFSELRIGDNKTCLHADFEECVSEDLLPEGILQERWRDSFQRPSLLQYHLVLSLHKTLPTAHFYFQRGSSLPSRAAFTPPSFSTFSRHPNSTCCSLRGWRDPQTFIF